jgi:hypothetical protein
VTHQGTAAHIEGSDAHAIPFGFRRIQQCAARVGMKLDFQFTWAWDALSSYID